MDLIELANETLAIVDAGRYTNARGEVVEIGALVAAAVADTRLYRPDDFSTLWSGLPVGHRSDPVIEVTSETTAAAGRRLVAGEGRADTLALNFASAKNPGGGFLRGAKAQEEDLARCSALYRCQVQHGEYYRANREFPSLLYTDSMIHSPRVPFFRDEKLALLDEPFTLSILTSPAPNAGELLAREPDAEPKLRATLEERAVKVLTVAATHGHRNLILGAWGCGVFRNDPTTVAQAFARALDEERLEGAFDKVVFAVYDPHGKNRAAFEKQFGEALF